MGPSLILHFRILILLFLCLIQAQAAEEGEISNSLPPSQENLPTFNLTREEAPPDQPSTETRVGDSIRFSIQDPALPGVANPSQELEITPPKENQDWEFILSPGTEKSLQFTAIPLKPGPLNLPSLDLKIKTSPEKVAGRTQPLTVDVVSAIQKDDPKPDQPVELLPPVGLAFPYWAVVLLTCLGVLAAFGIAFAFMKWKKRKKTPAPVAPKIPLPEDEVALAALDELKNSKLIQARAFKKHYFRLSEILKAYIGARYSIDALESTSYEVLKLLEGKSRVTEAQIDQVATFFEKLDRVKFTDFIPKPPEGESLLQEIRQFVVSTRRPREVLISSPELTSGKPSAPASAKTGGTDAIR